MDCSHVLSRLMRSSTRLALLALLGICILNLVILPTLAQDASPTTTNTTSTGNMSTTTPSPSGSSTSPSSSSSNSSSEAPTTSAPGASTTISPSGAMSPFTSCNSLFMSGFLVLVNWLAFSHFVN